VLLDHRSLESSKNRTFQRVIKALGA
jgi:hypothetical protein